ncbi:MAG: TraR/DksA C4-type zinc finger protein [Candidatus Omnitrophota bacterium]
MNQRDQKKMKKKLEEDRERIAKGIHSLENDALKKSQRDASGDLSGYAFHMADVATDNFDREFNLDLASSEQRFLNDIDTALKRIDDGTYGRCEMCDRKIKMERLMAVPHARKCIECKKEEEQNEVK